MFTSTNSATRAAQIMIAGKSDVDAYALRHIFQAHGHAVSVVGDAASAFESVLQHRPALVVSDINMPGIDGYELCRRIKASAELSGTQVFLVSSKSEHVDVLQGLKSRADGFIAKPYEKSHLLARMAKSRLGECAHPAEDEGPPLEIAFQEGTHLIAGGRQQILNFMMSIYEITVQRREEFHESREQLKERTLEVKAANRFMDSVIENIPDMIFIKDATDLRYVKINLAAEQLLGYSRAEMIGKNDADFFPPSESHGFTSRDREVLSGQTPFRVTESLVHTAHHGIRLIRTKKVALLDQHAVPTHVLGITQDITEQRELENKVLSLNASLAAHTQELEVANESLESFTLAATHDLRMPLRSIGGYAALLEMRYAKFLDANGTHFLSAIKKNAKNMDQLIDDLLAFSRSSLKEMKKSPADMDSMVEQVMADVLELHLEKKKPVVRIQPLPGAQGDAGLLRQVWVNLISNAVKYSRDATSPFIEISGRIEGAETVYSVKDNGAGFDMAHHDKLFEMFQRLHAESEFEGTGVGLSIVNRIVTRHGGRVWAEGKIGEGAVFHFALPFQIDLAVLCSAAA